jgi:hypothetical protein
LVMRTMELTAEWVSRHHETGWFALGRYGRGELT